LRAWRFETTQDLSGLWHARVPQAGRDSTIRGGLCDSLVCGDTQAILPIFEARQNAAEESLMALDLS